MIDKIKLKEFVLYFMSKCNSESKSHVMSMNMEEMLEKIEKDDCDILIEDDTIMLLVDGRNWKIDLIEYFKWSNQQP